MAYLSRQARTMLDQAGFPQAGIVASNDLDEETIQDIKTQGAPISAWGVGTALITSRNYSALGGVYKLSAVYEAERWIPKLKISENSDKITLPGIKQVLRFFGATDGMAMADLITLEGEEYTQGQPLTIFHPIETWKRKTLQNFVTQKLLVQVMADGQLIHDLPSVLEIQAYAKQQQALLWDEHKRLKFPQQYIVDLSKNLWELRANLISAAEPVSS